MPNCSCCGCKISRTEVGWMIITSIPHLARIFRTSDFDTAQYGNTPRSRAISPRFPASPFSPRLRARAEPLTLYHRAIARTRAPSRRCGNKKAWVAAAAARRRRHQTLRTRRSVPSARHARRSGVSSASMSASSASSPRRRRVSSRRRWRRRWRCRGNSSFHRPKGRRRKRSPSSSPCWPKSRLGRARASLTCRPGVASTASTATSARSSRCPTR
jgi:hypothetical protein